MFRRFGCLVAVTILCFGLAAPIPASAESTSLVIYQLQTGSATSASQEYIRIYNNSLDEVDVTDWCITKSSSSDITKSQLGCLTSPVASVRLMLPSHGSLTLATNEFVTAHTGFIPDMVFSADIAASAGHIRILDPSKLEIDRLGWGTAVTPELIASPAHGSGKILQRKILDGDVLKDTDNNSADFMEETLLNLPDTDIYELEIIIDVCGNLDDIQTDLPDGYLFDTTGNCVPDVCLNIDGLQIDVPDSYEILVDGICSLVPLEGATLIISELLPNVTSYDTGKEFIEIYNPNDKSINLKGYLLQVGPNFSKSYSLPDQNILPNQYIAFSDTITKIVLSNTSSSLRLIAPNGAEVNSTDTYLSPADNMAWALLGTSWQYTNQPTPNAPNVASLEDNIVADEEVSILGPCAVGQYRSLETNRCRLIQPAISQYVPCKPGQERNPETNRCRSVLASTSTLVPCKPGQERNPETNRCRSTTTSTLVPCNPGQERNPETNRCRKVEGAVASAATADVQDVSAGEIVKNPRWWLAGGAILFALSYALYEWRRDISNLIIKHRTKSQK